MRLLSYKLLGMPCLLVANPESLNKVIDILDSIVSEATLEMSLDNLRKYPIVDQLKSEVEDCI